VATFKFCMSIKTAAEALLEYLCFQHQLFSTVRRRNTSLLGHFTA
jgi:hypothetical protein